MPSQIRVLPLLQRSVAADLLSQIAGTPDRPQQLNLAFDRSLAATRHSHRCRFRILSCFKPIKAVPRFPANSFLVSTKLSTWPSRTVTPCQLSGLRLTSQPA